MLTAQQIPPGTFYSGVPIPEDWPSWLKGISVAAETVEYKGEVFTYAVAKRDFNEEARQFPGFVAYIQGYTLVSEDVIPNCRPYFALHEIIEMAELTGQKDRCLNALKIELSHVPEHVLPQYCAYRLLFFMRLVDFHEEHNGDSEELAEMRKSLRYLAGR